MATSEQIIEERVADHPARSHNTDRLNVAYIMSRFPKLTETFVLYEMLALQGQGVGVEIFPLINERTTIMHEEAKAFAARARYQPMVSWPIMKAQWHFLRTRPRAYLGLWWEVLHGAWGSANYVIGGLGILPKAARFAEQVYSELGKSPVDLGEAVARAQREALRSGGLRNLRNWAGYSVLRAGG